MTLLLPEFALFFWTLFAILLYGILAAYLNTIRLTLKAIPEEDRSLNPSKVWLSFIPVLNLVWHPIMVVKLARSLETTYRTNSIPRNAGDVYVSGLLLCIVLVLKVMGLHGLLSFTIGLTAFLFHWMTVYQHLKSLKSSHLYQHSL